MRTLHLIDDQHLMGPPEGALAAIALLQQRDGEHAHALVALLPPEDADLVRFFGATLSARIGITSGRARSAVRALGPILDRMGPFDRVQAWSPQTLRVARALPGLAVLPPAPPDPPVDTRMFNAAARRRWRERLGIGNDEIVITLIELDPEQPNAGNFGLTIPPLTCAIQDRAIVGLIPGRQVSDGAVRAARYAGNAGNVWRIESVAAPRCAAALVADAVLCPSPQSMPDRWERWSSSQLALRCARAMSIPIISGDFHGSQPITQPIGSTRAKTRPGRVGIVTALFEALEHPAPLAPVVESTAASEDWLDRWRSSCRDRAVVPAID